MVLLSYAFLYLFAQLARGFGVVVRKRATEVDAGRSRYLWSGPALTAPSLIAAYGAFWLLRPVLNAYSSVALSESTVVALFLATTGFSALGLARYYPAGCSDPGLAEKLRTAVAKTTMPVLTAVALSASPTVEAALYAVFVAYTGTAVLTFWRSPHAFVVPAVGTVVDVLGYSTWSLPTAVLDDFYRRWDTVLLAVMVGSTAVGYHDSSLRIGFLATTFAVDVSRASNVDLSGLVETGQDITRVASRTVTAPILPFLLVTLSSGEYALELAFGPAYVGARWYLVLLVVVQPFRCYRLQFEAVFSGSDLPERTTGPSLVAVLVNVVTAPPPVVAFGGLGALYSTILAELVRLLVYQRQLDALVGQYLVPRGVLTQYVSFGVVLAAITAVERLLRPSDVVLFGVSCVLGTAGFYAVQYGLSGETRAIVAAYVERGAR